MPCKIIGMTRIRLTLIHHGFVKYSQQWGRTNRSGYESSYRTFRDVGVYQGPFNQNPRIIKAADNAQYEALRTFNELFPGKLILTFNPRAVYTYQNMVASENGVPAASDPL